MSAYDCLLTDAFIRSVTYIRDDDSNNVIHIYLNDLKDESQIALIKIKNFKMFKKILNVLRIQIHDNDNANDDLSIRGGENVYIIGLLLFLCINSIFASMIRLTVIHKFQNNAKSIKQYIQSIQRVFDNGVSQIDNSVRLIEGKIDDALSNLDFADQLYSLDKSKELTPYIEKIMSEKENIVNTFSVIQKNLNIATIVLEGIKKRSLCHTIGGFWGMIRDDMVNSFTTAIIHSSGKLTPHVNLMITMIKELPENMRSLEDLDLSLIHI
jgi:hypothetical protein